MRLVDIYQVPQVFILPQRAVDTLIVTPVLPVHDLGNLRYTAPMDALAKGPHVLAVPDCLPRPVSRDDLDVPRNASRISPSLTKAARWG
jgi:hypothetical protein